MFVRQSNCQRFKNRIHTEVSFMNQRSDFSMMAARSYITFTWLFPAALVVPVFDQPHVISDRWAMTGASLGWWHSSSILGLSNDEFQAKWLIPSFPSAQICRKLLSPYNDRADVGNCLSSPYLGYITYPRSQYITIILSKKHIHAFSLVYI